MPELRWILLGLGVLFCLGLWWWEARRGRQAADGTVATVVRDDQRRELVDAPEAARELPPWNAPAESGEQVTERPAAPVQSLDEVELPPVRESIGRTRFDTELKIYDPDSGEFTTREPMIDIAAERPVRGAPSASLRIEPVIGDAAAAVRAASAAEPIEARPPPPPQEKIVTVRVAAPPLERFEGRLLVGALRSAGLEHGKFSVFHKTSADGRTLFSVASLVEPGTFDLEAIDGRRFPGVSFFTVLTADSDSGATLEDMLGTARALASSLHGNLQDERGTPMSPQRLADLRADVAAWARRAHRPTGAA